MPICNTTWMISSDNNQTMDLPKIYHENHSKATLLKRQIIFVKVG